MSALYRGMLLGWGGFALGHGLYHGDLYWIALGIIADGLAFWPRSKVSP
jgi:hypothetical protein